MNIRKPYISFLAWPSCFALGSLVLTCFGWLVFVASFRGALPAWIPETLISVVIWICLWPSLLLESIGLQITNHSTGFFPNAIGWGNIGIVPAYIIHRKPSNNKVLSRTVDPA